MGCGLSKTPKTSGERRRLSVLTVKKDGEKDSAIGEVKPTKGQVNVVDTLLELLPEGERRFSVVGQQPLAAQNGFDNKTIAVASRSKSESEKVGEDTLSAEFGIGYVCKKGLKPESPNQDDFFVLQVDKACGIYGVFDGHGPFGHDISHFAHQLLPAILLRSDDFQENPSDALRRAFLKTHQQLAKAQEKGKFDCSLSGTTGTVLLIKENVLYVAHVGDSRAVMAIQEPSMATYTAMDLSVDHKPGNEAEKARIHAAGGQVRCLQGDVNDRVFIKNKLYPGLAMSRSIGDLVGASAGVTSDPEISNFPLGPSHKFMMVCSDGVWEFITSQEAVDLVSSFSPSQAMEAAEALSQEAWKRWIQEEGNVVDDITVIVVHLHKNGIASTGMATKEANEHQDGRESRSGSEKNDQNSKNAQNNVEDTEEAALEEKEESSKGDSSSKEA